MRYTNITTCDIANGKGVGVVLWCQGCSLACPGCHNFCTHSPLGGEEYTDSEEALIMKELARPQISRLTLSGGHPLEPYNLPTCTELCKRVKKEFPNTKIWVYTGFLWEDVKDYEIMQYIDVLVDGPFIEEFRDISLPYCGSLNQRIIDVPASLKSTTVKLAI